MVIIYLEHKISMHAEYGINAHTHGPGYKDVRF